MDEKAQEKMEESKSEDTPADNKNVGIQSQAESLIEQSNKAAERNEKVLAELKKENDRFEKLQIEQKLAGKGQAGQAPQVPTISKEEQASRDRIKEVGNATGANWAANMDKENDENRL